MTYTAREVQEALEEHTWIEQHPVYAQGEPTRPGGWRPYLRDENDRLIEVGTEDVTFEFDWSEAEDMVGHTFDVLGGVTVIASDPGGEGHGENIWTVVRADETGQLFKIQGYYSSYGEGSTYDSHLYEVKAKEKVVIVYE